MGLAAVKTGLPEVASSSPKPEAVSADGDDAEVVPPSGGQVYSRGVGVYPGDPSQYFGPTLIEDGSTYRNLALRRPAYHSSSYDYNLTAQLVTDGIIHSHLPTWVSTSAGFRGQLSKVEREFFLDHNPTSTVELRFGPASVQVQLGGGSVPKVDRVELLVGAQSRGPKPEGLTFAVSVSDDGRAWKEAGKVSGPEAIPLTGYPEGFAQPGQLFAPSIPFSAPVESRNYRVDCRAANVTDWQIGEVAFFYQNQRVEIGGPYDFTSAWMSAGLGEEWVYVDLGAVCEFDRVKLYWVARAAQGSLLVSDDAQSWREVRALPESTSDSAGLIDDVRLSSTVKGRYVRVLMTRPASPYGYILSEIEVYGRGGFVAQAGSAGVSPALLSSGEAGARGPALSEANGTSSLPGRRNLAGGAWRLQRDSLVTAGGEALSTVGFQDGDWVLATVPGTVLTSFLNLGALPDPNYGDNQLMISDSFFYADFWYRKEFEAPTVGPGAQTWVNFDGINWKADVFLNGEKLGRIEGGFMRGRFDVTGRLRPGQKNALAVCVRKNATPGSVKQKTF